MKEIITTDILQTAITWFHKNKREMPWRDVPTPYRVWISEIMLQQTTVATVHNYFLRFIKRFPTLKSLAEASEEEVLQLWAGLGYYSRARNILKTAQLLGSENKFPSTKEELLKLPGIGPYTASAVSSIAFRQPDALVDTNVDRVLGRYFGLMRTTQGFERMIATSAQEMMNTISTQFPEEICFWNQILMEIGALLCSTTKTLCTECPLNKECIAYNSRIPLNFPGEKRKAVIIEKEEKVLIIKFGKKIVLSKNHLTRRKGLYDFKMIESKTGENLGNMVYRISNDKITRMIFCIQDNNYILQDNEILVSPDQASEYYPLTSPCKKIIQKYL